MTQIDTTRAAEETGGKPMWPAAVVILLVVFGPALLMWGLGLLRV